MYKLYSTMPRSWVLLRTTALSLALAFTPPLALRPFTPILFALRPRCSATTKGSRPCTIGTVWVFLTTTARPFQLAYTPPLPIHPLQRHHQKEQAMYNPKELRFLHCPIVDFGTPSDTALAKLVPDLQVRSNKLGRWAAGEG